MFKNNYFQFVVSKSFSALPVITIPLNFFLSQGALFSIALACLDTTHLGTFLKTVRLGSQCNFYCDKTVRLGTQCKIYYVKSVRLGTPCKLNHYKSVRLGTKSNRLGTKT